jgi:hypothetical protein
MNRPVAADAVSVTMSMSYWLCAEQIEKCQLSFKVVKIFMILYFQNLVIVNLRKEIFVCHFAHECHKYRYVKSLFNFLILLVSVPPVDFLFIL